MPFSSRFVTAVTTALLSGFTIALPGRAAEFGQQPIAPDRVVAVASPIRDGQLYNLLILEQVGNQRPCWEEAGGQPTQIDPLLLSFDFSGICDRYADSNGYSVRVNNEDLGGSYRLQVVRRRDTLILQAVPIRSSAAVPPLEIGQASSADGFVKIDLNTGWQMTRRTYNGRPLNHIYFSHDAQLDVPLATGTTPLATASGTRPVAPPTTTAPIVPPPPPTVANAGDHFRVIVAGNSDTLLRRVRAIEPNAFRAVVNGESVIQVGIFQEQWRADDIYRALAQANLPAKVITSSAPAVASTPAPSTPEILPIPQGQIVVMIDPGHGGRDPGAIGIGGIQEKAINLTIARRVQQQLQAAGLTVIMTRTDDQTVDLEPRVAYAERANTDVFVSIHANAISMDRPEVNGLETYYYSSGARLAQAIHNRVLQRTDLADRGVRTARFYVLRRTSMPAVLVETGFVTGARDAARFRNPAEVERIADAIAEGILDYLR